MEILVLVFIMWVYDICVYLSLQLAVRVRCHSFFICRFNGRLRICSVISSGFTDLLSYFYICMNMHIHCEACFSFQFSLISFTKSV